MQHCYHFLDRHDCEWRHLSALPTLVSPDITRAKAICGLVGQCQAGDWNWWILRLLPQLDRHLHRHFLLVADMDGGSESGFKPHFPGDGQYGTSRVQAECGRWSGRRLVLGRFSIRRIVTITIAMVRASPDVPSGSTGEQSSMDGSS